MPAPPPFSGKAAFHGPCSPAGCQGAAASSREGSRGRGPSSPSSPPSLPSPGRCGRLPSLLRKRVTPRARGQRPRGAAHGSHLQLGAHLPAWLRDQTGNKNSPAWPEPHALLPAATGEPRHPRPAAFGVASDPPFPLQTSPPAEKMPLALVQKVLPLSYTPAQEGDSHAMKSRPEPGLFCQAEGTL